MQRFQMAREKIDLLQRWRPRTAARGRLDPRHEGNRLADFLVRKCNKSATNKHKVRVEADCSWTKRLGNSSFIVLGTNCAECGWRNARCTPLGFVQQE